MAAALAISVAHAVYRIPIQVSDSLEAILISRHSPSSLALLADTARSSSTTLRPMRYVQARWLGTLADTAGISYHAAFRGAHAALAVLMVALLVWIADPRGWLDMAALACALTVLVGLHTFDAMMREAFPVNHYAEVAVSSLFVMAAARRAPHWARELLAVVLLGAGLLLIESSVLIWLAIVSCAALRMPGMRPRTAVAATVVLAAGLAARVALGISSPGIGSHNTGWGAVVLPGDEAAARFASNPWPLFAYNVAGGALSLLLSEPRFGVYQLLYARTTGALSPVVPINMVSSLMMSSLVTACCWTLLRSRITTWDNDRKTLAVGVVLVGASAALCVTYIKDDILSTAGVAYAAMSFFAVRWLLARAVTLPPAKTAAAAAFLFAVASLWAFRAVGTHYELTRTAFVTRNDWALKTTADLAGGERATPSDFALTRRIRGEALHQPTTSPSFLPDWGERYWIE